MNIPSSKVVRHLTPYAMESAITEVDALQIAQQLAMYRLSKGRVLTERRHVFSHPKTLLQFHGFGVFALLLLDTEHRVTGFKELFRGALELPVFHLGRRSRSPWSKRSSRNPSTKPSFR